MKSENPDSYKTLLKATEEVLYKDRNSKFYGYAFPLNSKGEAEVILKQLSLRHRRASHLCYAWNWGVQQPYHRVNDDGEPTHAAGMPIYGQIQSFDLTNVLVAVIRIYGGTKLGIGGLVRAYRATARMALEAGVIINKTPEVEYLVTCGYPNLGALLRIFGQPGISIIKQDMQRQCIFHIAVRLNKSVKTESLIRNIPGVILEKPSA